MCVCVCSASLRLRVYIQKPRTHKILKTFLHICINQYSQHTHVCALTHPRVPKHRHMVLCVTPFHFSHFPTLKKIKVQKQSGLNSPAHSTLCHQSLKEGLSPVLLETVNQQSHTATIERADKNERVGGNASCCPLSCSNDSLKSLLLYVPSGKAT